MDDVTSRLIFIIHLRWQFHSRSWLKTEANAGWPAVWGGTFHSIPLLFRLLLFYSILCTLQVAFANVKFLRFLWTLLYLLSFFFLRRDVSIIMGAYTWKKYKAHSNLLNLPRGKRIELSNRKKGTSGIDDGYNSFECLQCPDYSDELLFWQPISR